MYREVVEQLQKRQGTEAGELAGVVDLYLDVWHALERAAGRIDGAADLPERPLAARIEQGKPLCELEELSIDWDLFGSLFGELASLMCQHGLIGKAALCDVQEAVQSPASLEALTKAWYAGRSLRGWREHFPSTRIHTLRFLAANAALPFLRREAMGLVGQVDLRLWQRGRCPVCGGPPGFAGLAGDTGTRTLLCSRCATQWPYKRLACPFCASENQDLLGYFPAANGRHRIFVCDRCHRYLKAVNLPAAEWEPVSLVVESLLTPALDESARSAGYH